MGRCSRYTPELAERVLQQLRVGRPLRDICGDAGMPSARCVQGWVRHDCQGFAAAYAEARRIGRARLGLLPTPAWSRDLADRVLRELRRRRALIDVCRDPGMPRYGTVRAWITDNRHDFAAAYRQAVQAGGTRWARPVRYSRELAEIILDGLCAGRSLADVCRDPGMPSQAAVRRWAREDRDGFAARYQCARQMGCDTLMGDILRIADSRDDWILSRTADGRIERVLDEHRIKRRELACQARIWLVERMLPAAQRDWQAEARMRVRLPTGSA